MEVSNSSDIIDSRDVIARIEEMERQSEWHEPDTCDVVTCPGCTDEVRDELAALKAFAEEGESATGTWSYGATLIRDSYFEDYARDFANDIGAIDNTARWPNTCIDWEQAASELQVDYTSVEFDGVTYWVR